MAIQYKGDVFGSVDVGHIFIISGTSIPGAIRLDITLKSGKLDTTNSPFHLSIRFREDMIIRNSMINKAWGMEEKDQNLHPRTAKNPIKAGANFKIYIYVGESRFFVSIDDNPYCTYGFRLPLANIKSIEVNKDLSTIFQVDHRSSMPSPYPIILLNDPKLHFSNDIPKRFSPGHIMVITGTPLGAPNGQFVLKFLEGATKKQALHFNPRFAPQNVVIRNAMNNDLTFSIPLEERSGGFPFGLNMQFKIAIAFTPTEFWFAINGKSFATFKYRTQNQLNVLNGLKAIGKDGMRVEITSVDHIESGICDWKTLEAYSKK